MEKYGEFYNARNAIICQFHADLTIQIIERRLAGILENSGTYSPYEIELVIDLGPFPEKVSYGVIRTREGRIFELHILDHPGAVNSAFIGLMEKRDMGVQDQEVSYTQ